VTKSSHVPPLATTTTTTFTFTVKNHMYYYITNIMDTSNFVGTGFAYLQSKLLKPISSKSNKSVDEQSNNETGSSCSSSLVPDGPNLSENAKRILMQLLQQEKVQLNNYRKNSVSSILISDFVKSTDTSQHQLSKQIVTLDMSDDMILDLAYNQDISLLGSILSVIDQYPNVNLSTTSSATSGGGGATSTSVSSNYILQRCALTVIPQKTPGLLSAKEMIYAALHFLCQEYPPSTKKGTDSDITSITVQLPLIQSTSMSNDIERRSYEKLYDWDLNSILSQIFVLEQYFYNAIHIDYTLLLSQPSSTSPTTLQSETKRKNCLMWLPREMFIPNKIPYELQREILVKGSIPEETKNSITTTSKNTGTSTKNKSKSSIANTNANSSSSGKKRKSQSTPTTTSSKDELESTTSPKPKMIIKKIKITPIRKLTDSERENNVAGTTTPETSVMQSEQLENDYETSEAQISHETSTTFLSPIINNDITATMYDVEDNDDVAGNDDQLQFG
jgi:hypothetical protein